MIEGIDEETLRLAKLVVEQQSLEKCITSKEIVDWAELLSLDLSKLKD